MKPDVDTTKNILDVIAEAAKAYEPVPEIVAQAYQKASIFRYECGPGVVQ